MTRAATKLHTLYRPHEPGRGLDATATIDLWSEHALPDDHRDTPYHLTTIARGIASTSSWFASESAALEYARQLGFDVG